MNNRINWQILKLFVFLNSLLVINLFSVKVSAQDACTGEDIKAEVQTVCDEIAKLKLQMEVIKAQKDLLNAEKELATTALENFKFNLPTSGLPDSLKPLDGTSTVEENAFNYEAYLLANKATKQVVTKMYDALKNSFSEGGSSIYVSEEGDNNGLSTLFSAYQKYDYFNIQYQTLVKSYASVNKALELKEQDREQFFNELRSPESSSLAGVPTIAAISSVAGSIIEIGRLFNVNTKFSAATPSGLSSSTLVGEIFRQFNDDEKNNIYYPKLLSLELADLDKVTNQIIELIYLQQLSKTAIGKKCVEVAPNNCQPIQPEDITKLMAINEEVNNLLKGITKATDNDNSIIISSDAESTIASLAQGYSLYKKVTSVDASSKRVYLLFITPTFGGGIKTSQSIFGGSPKVSGSAIVHYKLYRIDRIDGNSDTSKIVAGGSVSHYIPYQKFNDITSN